MLLADGLVGPTTGPDELSDRVVQDLLDGLATKLTVLPSAMWAQKDTSGTFAPILLGQMRSIGVWYFSTLLPRSAPVRGSESRWGRRSLLHNSAMWALRRPGPRGCAGAASSAGIFLKVRLGRLLKCCCDYPRSHAQRRRVQVNGQHLRGQTQPLIPRHRP